MAMYISKNINFLRKGLGFTQGDVAEKIGKTIATVSDYEKGRSLPPLDITVKLCNLFGVTLDELVNRDLAREGYAAQQPLPKEHTDKPNQELLNRLLVQKLEEVAEELKENYPEAYRKLKLEELIRKGK